jgi:hypothetical protein
VATIKQKKSAPVDVAPKPRHFQMKKIRTRTCNTFCQVSVKFPCIWYISVHGQPQNMLIKLAD